MKTCAKRGHSRRTLSAVVAAVLASIAALASVGPARADETLNTTPETAATISALPVDLSLSQSQWDLPAATDPVSARVATACNAGGSIYGTLWWRFLPSSDMTFVVHTLQTYGTYGSYDPTGTALVSGDLMSVLECGTPAPANTRTGFDITRTGPATVSAGESAYLVTYRASSDGPPLTQVGVYASTGVIPSNDLYASATPIGSLPFSADPDTTLATLDQQENTWFYCDFSKWPPGPAVWFVWTASRTDLVDVKTTSDYWSTVRVVPLVGVVPGAPLCGTIEGHNERFAAEAGVTYLIGAYGWLGVSQVVRDSGRSHLAVDFVPAAPGVHLSVAATGTVNKKTGLATVKGLITCTGADPANTDPITGTLRQVHRRSTHQSSFSQAGVACTSEPVNWTANVSPGTFLYKGGSADLSATVTACNTRGCTSATARATVKLKVV